MGETSESGLAPLPKAEISLSAFPTRCFSFQLFLKKVEQKTCAAFFCRPVSSSNANQVANSLRSNSNLFYTHSSADRFPAKKRMRGCLRTISQFALPRGLRFEGGEPVRCSPALKTDSCLSVASWLSVEPANR